MIYISLQENSVFSTNKMLGKSFDCSVANHIYHEIFHGIRIVGITAVAKLNYNKKQNRDNFCHEYF